MKILKSVIAIAFIALLAIPYSSCNKEDEESCEQQDMNEVLNCGEEKNVEVCCVSGSSCTYKYDGNEYPDTDQGLNDLADALGCSYKGSAEYEAQQIIIKAELLKLRDLASCGD